MENTFYSIIGKDGVWCFETSYVSDDYVILVMKNIGSGEFFEIEICPFEFIINNKKHINKWDS